MIKLTELEPKEVEWVQQLITITSYLEEYNNETQRWNDRLLQLKREQWEPNTIQE